MFLLLAHSMTLESGIQRIDKSSYVSKFLILNATVLASWKMEKVSWGKYNFNKKNIKININNIVDGMMVKYEHFYLNQEDWCMS